MKLAEKAEGLYDRLFRREEYIKNLGIQMNADGTTSNLCEYVRHVREDLAGKSERYFWVYFFWGLFGGYAVYYICAFSLNNMVGRNG